MIRPEDDLRLGRARHADLAARAARPPEGRPEARYLGVVVGLGAGVTATGPVTVATAPVIEPLDAGPDVPRVRRAASAREPVDLLRGSAVDGDLLVATQYQGRWVAGPVKRNDQACLRSVRVWACRDPRTAQENGVGGVTVRFKDQATGAVLAELSTTEPVFGVDGGGSATYRDTPPGRALRIEVDAPAAYYPVDPFGVPAACNDTHAVQLCPRSVAFGMFVTGCNDRPAAGATVEVIGEDDSSIAGTGTVGDVNGQTFPVAVPLSLCNGSPAGFPAIKVTITPPAGSGLTGKVIRSAENATAPPGWGFANLDVPGCSGGVTTRLAVEPGFRCACGCAHPWPETLAFSDDAVATALGYDPATALWGAAGTAACAASCQPDPRAPCADPPYPPKPLPNGSPTVAADGLADFRIELGCALAAVDLKKWVKTGTWTSCDLEWVPMPTFDNPFAGYWRYRQGNCARSGAGIPWDRYPAVGVVTTFRCPEQGGLLIAGHWRAQPGQVCVGGDFTITAVA